jgi:recombination protein RecA
MDITKFLGDVKKRYGKTFKDEEYQLDLITADKELPPTGIVVDNPLFEYVLDRRFMAYGRCYLTYGRKGCSKTSLLFDMAKTFQKAGGYWMWVETEHAADMRYMGLQGVDPKRTIRHSTQSLEEALTLCKDTIETYAKQSDGTVPLLVALDSIAGAPTDYERDQEVVGDTRVGQHAKLMSAFYRAIVPYLESDTICFVATNQLKDKIGRAGPGGPGEALIGGDAQLFSSTYQWRVARVKDLTTKDAHGVERKSGSRHALTVKRNKLGREGNSQSIEYDLHINGGIDWYSSLVDKLADEYPALVKPLPSGYYWWRGETAKVYEPGSTEELLLEKERLKDDGKPKGLRASDLGYLICNAPDAKEQIRDVFGIPDMPTPEESVKIIKAAKAKGKKVSDLDDDGESSDPNAVLGPKKRGKRGAAAEDEE